MPAAHGAPGRPVGPRHRPAGVRAPEPLSFSPAAGGAELEVVIPERVALEKIHLLPPAVRGDRGSPRRRRALPRQRAAAEDLLLRLPAAGAELYLHLRRDLRFLARGFVVEQRRGEARRAPNPRRPPEERLCFYTGHVLNRSDSFASLSTCAGLVLPSRPPRLPTPDRGQTLRSPRPAPGSYLTPRPAPSAEEATPAHSPVVVPVPSPPRTLASIAAVPPWVFAAGGAPARPLWVGGGPEDAVEERPG